MHTSLARTVLFHSGGEFRRRERWDGSSGDRAAGALCCAPCPPSSACGRRLLLYFRSAEHPTGPIGRRRAVLAVQGRRRIRPRMAGIRLPEVKEEGRCIFGPGGVGRVSRSTAPRCRSRLAVQSKPWTMEGVGYPPSLARAGVSPTFHASRKTLSVMGTEMCAYGSLEGEGGVTRACWRPAWRHPLRARNNCSIMAAGWGNNAGGRSIRAMMKVVRYG